MPHPRTQHARTYVDPPSTQRELLLDPPALDLDHNLDEATLSAPVEVTGEVAPAVEVDEADWLEQHTGLAGEEEYPHRREVVRA